MTAPIPKTPLKVHWSDFTGNPISCRAFDPTLGGYAKLKSRIPLEWYDDYRQRSYIRLLEGEDMPPSDYVLDIGLFRKMFGPDEIVLGRWTACLPSVFAFVNTTARTEQAWRTRLEGLDCRTWYKPADAVTPLAEIEISPPIVDATPLIATPRAHAHKENPFEVWRGGSFTIDISLLREMMRDMPLTDWSYGNGQIWARWVRKPTHAEYCAVHELYEDIWRKHAIVADKAEERPRFMEVLSLWQAEHGKW